MFLVTLGRSLTKECFSRAACSRPRRAISVPPGSIRYCPRGSYISAMNRGSVSAAALMAAPGVLLRRQVRWTQWARWLALILSSGGGQFPEIASTTSAHTGEWRMLRK
jgi:hypothetical protein